MSARAEAKYRDGPGGGARRPAIAVLQGGGDEPRCGDARGDAARGQSAVQRRTRSVFTLDGHNELDASIMDGSTLKAGAVCGVTHIKNPVELARTVMEHSEYVMLSGGGAEEFALSRGFELVPQQLLSHRRALAAAGAHPRRRCRAVGADHFPCRHGRSGRARRRRPAGGGDLHRRHDRQTLSTHRRFAHHRRRHLCRRPFLRRIGHRTRRGVHSRRGGARYLRAHALRRPQLERGGARGGARGAAGAAAARAASSPSIAAARLPWNSIRRECFAPAAGPARQPQIAIYRAQSLPETGSRPSR